MLALVRIVSLLLGNYIKQCRSQFNVRLIKFHAYVPGARLCVVRCLKAYQRPSTLNLFYWHIIIGVNIIWIVYSIMISITCFKGGVLSLVIRYLIIGRSIAYGYPLPDTGGVLPL